MFWASEAEILAVRYWGVLVMMEPEKGRGEKAYSVDLDIMFLILYLNCLKQRLEPFQGAEITTDPEEVDFSETSLRARIAAGHAVPDALEDAGEGRYAYTCADEDCGLEFEDVF